MVYNKISPNSPSLLSAFLKRSFALDTRVVYFFWLHNSSYALRERAYAVRISPSSSTKVADENALFDIFNENKFNLFPFSIGSFSKILWKRFKNFSGTSILNGITHLFIFYHFMISPAEVFIFFSPL